MSSKSYKSYVIPREFLKDPALNWTALKSLKNVDSIKIIEFLMDSFPQLFRLYAHPNNLALCDTLYDHTLAVMRACVDLFKLKTPPFPFPQIPSIPHLELLLQLTLALHDIGKPIQGREYQKQNTLPIIRSVMSQLALGPMEQNLVLALVNNDYLGELVAFKASPHKTAMALAEHAARFGLPLLAFFTLQRAYFLSDAAYYPSVRQASFGPKEGYYWPKNSLDDPDRLERWNSCALLIDQMAQLGQKD